MGEAPSIQYAEQAPLLVVTEAVGTAALLSVAARLGLGVDGWTALAGSAALALSVDCLVMQEAAYAVWALDHAASDAQPLPNRWTVAATAVWICSTTGIARHLNSQPLMWGAAATAVAGLCLRVRANEAIQIQRRQVTERAYNASQQALLSALAQSRQDPTFATDQVLTSDLQRAMQTLGICRSHGEMTVAELHEQAAMQTELTDRITNRIATIREERSDQQLEAQALAAKEACIREEERLRALEANPPTTTTTPTTTASPAAGQLSPLLEGQILEFQESLCSENKLGWLGSELRDNASDDKLTKTQRAESECLSRLSDCLNNALASGDDSRARQVLVQAQTEWMRLQTKIREDLERD